MRIINKVSNLKKHLHVEKLSGHSIGLTPTMGALHQGHISLLNKSKQENNISVFSIFVNPTQFNQKEDLDKYPRKLDKDSEFLKSHGCDYVFAPSVKDVYPKNLKPIPALDISHIISNMEGPNRPGHFEGVAQVINRLLKIVTPDKIYMGQKDFQQFSLIDFMIKSFNIKTELRVCPTIRESDGLAMSSRNLRLEPSIREKAHIIYDMLIYSKQNLGSLSVDKLVNYIMTKLKIGEFRPEYFEIVDGFTFLPIEDPESHDYIVACTAVWAGEVRLIDNMILKGGKFIS